MTDDLSQRLFEQRMKKIYDDLVDHCANNGESFKGYDSRCRLYESMFARDYITCKFLNDLDGKCLKK